VKILSIETSCDETAIAILECTGGLEKPVFNVLGNVLVSQIDIHKEFGGVVPMLAKREHEKNLPVLLDQVAKKVCLDTERLNVDLIVVTSGPGLEPALWAGITFAEALGKKHDIPVRAVNHMEGHILSVLYENNQAIEFPALALLVSGGHTEIVSVKGFGDYEILGRTLDDAVGEAFDKVARILGLPYPGGPLIGELARMDRIKHILPTFTFTMPMLHSKDLNFSYSGLKTAVLYKVRSMEALTDTTREEIARAFEDAAIGILIEKTKRALTNHEAKTLIVGGGVSANNYLREKLSELGKEFTEITLLLPKKEVSTDNAIMIGIAGYIEYLRNPDRDETLTANGNLSL
jgi:N6-L-threonylcarbamoyladenine synthase